MSATSALQKQAKVLSSATFPPQDRMPTDNRRPAVRFGPYEVNFRAGELRKNGIRIRIQAKPLAVLAALVESAGEVVSREQLRAALWDDGTFVDFDKNLSTAVNKLRGALSDSPEEPRYIETVPRRGYRFLAQVETLKTALAAQPAIESTSKIPVGEADAQAAPVFSGERRKFQPKDLPEVTVPLAAEEPVKGKPHPVAPRRWFWLFAAASLLIALMVAQSVLVARNGVRLKERDSIVIADFTNNTGDPVFDDTLKTALGIALRQSPLLNVLSDNEVANALKLMDRPSNATLTTEIARDVCLRAGSKAYIAGTIGSSGGNYLLELTAVNCSDGDTLRAEQVTSHSRNKVLSVLGDTATRLRSALGESLASVRKFDIPLEQATTPSLEALKAYSLGQKAAREKGAAESLPYIQRAIELDPNFAMAYAAAGIHYYNLAEPARASEYLTKAFELREHASERERLKISASYYSSVTGELDKAAKTYQEMIASYPRDIAAYNNQGIVLAEQGEYEKALRVTKQATHLAPDEETLHENLTGYLLALQRFDDARQIIREAQPRKPDNYVFPAALYALAFLASDFNGMVEQERWFAGRREYENFGLGLASDTDAFVGRLRTARQFTQRAVSSAVQSDKKEAGAIWQAIAAQREASYGFGAEARRSAVQALKLDPTSQAVEVESALALALAGDAARAESLARDVKKRFPVDTQIQSLWLPAIQAQLELDHNDPVSALNTLQAARPPLELGTVTFSANASGSCLYPTYIRGRSYLAGGNGRAAAAEFDKILDHPGIVWNCWTGALAHLGKARAHALEARDALGVDADAARVRAIAEYKAFLALWKDADPDIPILKQAQAEFANLQ